MIGGAGRHQSIGLIPTRELLDEFVDGTVEHDRQIEDRVTGPVIGDSVLWEVVRTDLLRALAAAYLRSSGVVQLRTALLFLDLVQTGPQDGHCPQLVLQLRAL